MTEDSKTEVLKRHRCLNRNAHRVRDQCFLEEAFFDPRDLLQVKYEMLRAIQSEQLPIAHGAARFGLSRPACYKAIKSFDADGMPGLLARRPGPRRPHKLTPEVVAFLNQAAARHPSPGMKELADMVREQFNLTLNRRSIRRALAPEKKTSRKRP